MALSLSDVIKGIYQDYEEIDADSLSILAELVSGEVERFNGGRFSGNDLMEVRACFVLDRWTNRAGSGAVTEEKVKDYSYKLKVSSSSYYMDLANTKRDKYDSSQCTVSDIGSGVTRDDSEEFL
jgi:hypothetical protein